MMKWINKKRNKKGFTLVELVVVIAILGILAAIAIPKLTSSRKNAAVAAHNANVRVLYSAATMYIAEKGVPATDAVEWQTGDESKGDENGWGDYLQSWPKAPTGTGLDGVDTEEYIVTIHTDGDIVVKNSNIVAELDPEDP